MRPIRILFVTPEFGDLVKVGGLGDISAALPRALRRLCDIRVLVPGYRRIVSGPEPIEMVGDSDALAGLPACSIGRLQTPDGMSVYVVLSSALYDRDGTPYCDPSGQDWHDNDIRFGRFAAAAADLAQGLVDPDWRPDLVHVNDWPSALVPAYLHWRNAHIPTILTIHNLAYQGLFARDTLARIGAVECVSHRWCRVLSEGVVHEGGARLCEPSHHREQHLCGRDHHPAVWLRARWASPRARAES